jgi:hypothetical protein
LSGGREFEFAVLALAREKPMRDLQKDTGAVASVWFTTASPAMFQVQEHLDGLFYDSARASPFHVNNEAKAARLVLVKRIVQSLLFGGRPLLHLKSRYLKTRFGM